MFAVDLTGKNIYFRTGVTSVDLTGKTWQSVHLEEDLAFLQREGLLSEGDICYCGDPDVPCDLHAETRPRLSSTATTASSISTTTNVEESSDGLVSPQPQYQPFPEYIMEPFPFDSASFSSPWKQPHFITGDSDHESDVQDISQTKNIPDPESVTGTSMSSNQLLSDITEENNIVNKDERQLETTANLQQSVRSYKTMTTAAISQTFALSQGSSSDEATFDYFEAMASPVKANHTLIENTTDTVSPVKANHTLTENTSDTDSPVKANHTLMENSPDTVSPSDNQSLECVSMLSGANTEVPASSRMKYKCSADSRHHIEKSRMVTKTLRTASVSGKLQEVDLETYEEAHASSRDNEAERKVELISTIHHTPQRNNIQIRTQQVEESYDGPTLLAQTSVKDSGFSTELSDRKLLTPMMTENIFGEDNSISNILLSDVAESMVDNRKIVRQMGKLSVEGDNSLTVSSSVDKMESKPEIISTQTNDKQLIVHKKKSKERRPKLINLSYNDPGDDSILFKTYKTRKKKRGKPVNIVGNKNKKADTNSVSSDTSHSLTDVTELRVANGVTVPDEDQRSEAVDFTDGHVHDLYSHGQHQEESSYQGLSADNSYHQSAFPSLSILYGEYLSTAGFSTDSAHALLTNLETLDAHLTQPLNAETHNLVNKLDIANVPARNSDRLSPVVLASDTGSLKQVAASATGRPTLVDAANNGISSKVHNAETDRVSPKPAMPFNNIDSKAIVNAVSNIHSPKSDIAAAVLTYDNLRHSNDVFNKQHSNDQAGLQGANDFRPDIIGHDTATVNSTKQDTDKTNSLDATAHINSPITIVSNSNKGNKNIPVTNITDENAAVKNWTVSLLPADETVKYISVEENENNTPCTNLAIDITVDSKDTPEFGCGGEHRLDIYVSDSVSDRNISGQDEVKNKSNVEGRQLLKIGEFSDKKFISLDSSASEEIIDFVTVSDDETPEKKSEDTRSCPECSLAVDKAEDVTQSHTALESIASSISKFHSQVSIASSRSSGSGMSSLTRDFNENVDYSERTPSLNAQASPHSISTAVHPRSLSIGSKKVLRYFKTPSPSQVPTGDVIPLMGLTEAQPRLCWRWLDATSCVIDDPSAIYWLSYISKG